MCRPLNVKLLLAAGVFAFGEAVFAIDGAIALGFKGNFALFLALGARRLEHFLGSAESTTTLISHVVFLLCVLLMITR